MGEAGSGPVSMVPLHRVFSYVQLFVIFSLGVFLFFVLVVSFSQKQNHLFGFSFDIFVFFFLF